MNTHTHTQYSVEFNQKKTTLSGKIIIIIQTRIEKKSKHISVYRMREKKERKKLCFWNIIHTYTHTYTLHSVYMIDPEKKRFLQLLMKRIMMRGWWWWKKNFFFFPFHFIIVSMSFFLSFVRLLGFFVLDSWIK